MAAVPDDHEHHNREFWDADADDYQAVHGEQLSRGMVWGAWAIPETELGVLGDVAGLAVLEYGCGAAQWSIALHEQGARVVGLDQSGAQLRHAARLQAERDISFPLLCASGESVPLQGDSLDLVFGDHGAMSFCDPDRSVPEVARLLRRGGRLVFNKATLLHYLTWDGTKERASRKLRADYFGSRVWAEPDGTADFQLPYGDWIRTFRSHDLTLEDLIELQPPADASTSYGTFVQLDWSRRWPAEEIWVLRKT